MQRRIQGRGPGLLLDQMKGPKRNFFGAPPRSEGLDRPLRCEELSNRGRSYPTRVKAEVDNNAAIPKQLS